MSRVPQLLVSLLAVVVCHSAVSYAYGDGDYCVHISNSVTGPDTAAIGEMNTLEIWLANDALLAGMGPTIEITFATDFEWNQGYGPLPMYGTIAEFLREHGRAVECWVWIGGDEVQVQSDFDEISPEHLGLVGVADPGYGLPAAASELCYSLQFLIPGDASEVEDGICIVPYFDWPSFSAWMFDDGQTYPPDFCGQDVADPYDPVADPVCFPIIIREAPFICGDANGDDLVNIADGVYLISYIFGGGPPPDPLLAGDVNCDGVVNIADVVYLIAYIFGGGPEPCASCP